MGQQFLSIPCLALAWSNIHFHFKYYLQRRQLVRRTGPAHIDAFSSVLLELLQKGLKGSCYAGLVQLGHSQMNFQSHHNCFPFRQCHQTTSFTELVHWAWGMTAAPPIRSQVTWSIPAAATSCVAMFLTWGVCRTRNGQESSKARWAIWLKEIQVTWNKQCSQESWKLTVYGCLEVHTCFL